MKQTLSAALLLLIALPLAAQVNDTYVIPVAGNVPGAFGTRWMTQFSVFNPQIDYSLKVSVVYLPTGGGKGIEALLTVPPNSVWHSDNALGEIFGVSGTGSLLLATFPEDNPGVPNDVVSRSFLVTTSTYNNSPAGTFGQSIPGIWTGLQDYDSDGISAVAHGIRHIARLGWRTNIGAVNLGRASVTMRVTVYDEDGRRILNRAPFVIPPMGHIQDRLPVEVDRGSVEFFVEDPRRDAVVFPYASTIDQYSGDPTYQSPTLLASAKVLYPKGAAQPSSPGTKIDLGHARRVRENATRIGEVVAQSRGRQAAQ
ncbi:MAG TPA: hypothetical protein VNL91_07805 [Thermoanaerobaculia bacterium]|nr:hypothetical protein [Thermoanaerobaculia bacterium]